MESKDDDEGDDEGGDGGDEEGDSRAHATQDIKNREKDGGL